MKKLLFLLSLLLATSAFAADVIILPLGGSSGGTSLTGVTNTYIPYNNAGTLDDSPLTTDGTNVTNSGSLTVSGAQFVNVTTVNAATYDLLTTDYILNVTYTSTAAVTSLTLPTAQCVAGRITIVKDAGGSAGTNNITIDTEGAETIDGSATYVINSNYESINLYSDGSNWFVI